MLEKEGQLKKLHDPLAITRGTDTTPFAFDLVESYDALIAKF